MYDYLIGLSFEEAIGELETREIKFDFGNNSYENVLEIRQECEEDSDLSFKEIYIYIGNFWDKKRFGVCFDDDFKVAQIFEFEC